MHYYYRKDKYMKKAGVFLARMQPLHNAHLYLVKKALEECETVLIVLGSENKVDMIRNPYDISLRLEILRESLTEEENSKLQVITLPDWSMETDKDSDKIWGRYFYYNVVANLGQKHFSIYFSDDIRLLDNWFKETEVEDYITYRHFERMKIFDNLSATKIRQAFIDNNKKYIEENCPPAVINRFDELRKYYIDVTKNPKSDFSME